MPDDLPPDANSKKMTAAVLAVFFGLFGVHKFYLGYRTPGLVMLLVTLLTCGFGAVVVQVIGLVEGIVYFGKTDEDFYETYVRNKKGWF